MITRFAIVSLVFVFTLVSAQKKHSKTKKIKETNSPALTLDKRYPVYVRGQFNTCTIKPLIALIQDSLEKEGYIVIDSIKAEDKMHGFFRNAFGYAHRNNYEKSAQEIKAYSDSQFQTAKIYQDLFITNNSCLDSFINYDISIYMFPRANESLSQNFKLPIESPVQIVDIILSLIKRE